MTHDPLFNIALCFRSTVLLCTLLAILSIVWSSSKSALGGVVDQSKANKILETKIASSLTPIIASPNTQAATRDDDNDKHHHHEDPSSSTAGGSIRKSSQKERHDDDQGDVNEEIDSNETVSVTITDVPAAGVILSDASSPINADDASTIHNIKDLFMNSFVMNHPLSSPPSTSCSSFFFTILINSSSLFSSNIASMHLRSYLCFFFKRIVNAFSHLVTF
jgi:hypothetical protein